MSTQPKTADSTQDAAVCSLPASSCSALAGMSLDDLAKGINEEHAAAIGSARTTLDHACQCGSMLTVAKKKVNHGDWTEWIEVNTELSYRTAARYMQLATNLPRVADLDGVREASELLAEPRKEKPTPAQEYFAAPAEEEEEPEMPGDAAAAEQIARDVRKCERMDEASEECDKRARQWERRYAAALEIERLLRGVRVALDAAKATGSWEDFPDEDRKITKQAEQLIEYLNNEIAKR